jgi:hypothetical protein
MCISEREIYKATFSMTYIYLYIKHLCFRYHFEREDLQNTRFVRKLGDRNVTDVPIVLDWAIWTDGPCPPPAEKDGVMGEPTASACVSANSHCVNATQGSGYLCNCSKGYTGNPYVIGGCTSEYYADGFDFFHLLCVLSFLWLVFSI